MVSPVQYSQRAGLRAAVPDEYYPARPVYRYLVPVSKNHVFLIAGEEIFPISP